MNICFLYSKDENVIHVPDNYEVVITSHYYSEMLANKEDLLLKTAKFAISKKSSKDQFYAWIRYYVATKGF